MRLLNKELTHSYKITHITAPLVLVVFLINSTWKGDKNLPSSQIALAVIDPLARHRAAETRRHPAFLLAIMQPTNQRHGRSKGRISHRGNKWTKSLSQPMFLSPITWLHDVAGTFMDPLSRSWWIKTKLSWTGWNLFCDESHTKNKHFINNKALLYFIFSGWFNHFSLHFFSRVPSSCLWKWGLYWWAEPDIDFPSFLVWTFSGLLYYSRSIFPLQS